MVKKDDYTQHISAQFNTELEDIRSNFLAMGGMVEKQVVDQAKVHNLPEDRVIREVILAAQPTKQFVEADEVAAFTVFLCSDAARSVTGSVQLIDGGWTAR